MMDSIALDRALLGLRILITRPASQAKVLCELITNSGGVAVRFPTLEIVGIENSKIVLEQFQYLDCFDWVIFISANAVKYAQKAYNSAIKVPQHTKVAAIGKATARSLSQAGIKVDLMPTQTFNTEALLETSEMKNVKGLKCLIVRGRGGREFLADSLRKRGAEVNYIEVYQRRRPKTDVSSLIECWQNEGIDMVTVTSGDALENLVAMMGSKGWSLLKTAPVLVVSPRLKSKALEMGLDHVMLASEASDASIYDALCEFNRLNVSM